MIRRLRWKITGVTMLVAFMVLLAVGGIGTIFYYPILRLWEKYGKRGE